MADTLPPRNLPDHAEEFGRVLEARAAGVRKTLSRVKLGLDGYNRTNAAVTADLARRVQKLRGAAEDLEDAAEDLEEALKQVPIVKQLSVYNSNFTIPAGWRERGGGNFIVPEGMTRADIIVIGQALLWDEGSGGGGGGGGGTPTSFTAVSNDGTMTINFDSKMLDYAYRIFRVASGIEGVGRHGTVIAFMTVFVESVWKMYANSTVPDSLNYPHDAVGSDNDSLGLFQQRPSVGWGSVAELMDVEYNAQAFFGGPNGPNNGSPPGLLDIPGWESMGYGQAAQAVQISAFPERYDNWRNASEELYTAIENASSGTTPILQWPFVPLPTPDGDMPPDGSSDQELAEYGPRDLTGAFHEGMDFGYRNATSGAAIYAAGSGTVYLNQSGFMGYGNTIIIDHGTDSNGNTIYTLYAHRQSVEGPGAGQSVSTGDIIGHVGATGNVFGPHLHYEIHVVPPGRTLTWDYQNPSYESTRTAVDPRDYMNYGGGPPGGNPGPGPNPTYASRYGRLVVGGQVVSTPPSEYSEHPSKVMITGSGGRTMDVTPGQEIRVQFQARAGQTLIANEKTYAGFTAFGVFSP